MEDTKIDELKIGSISIDGKVYKNITLKDILVRMGIPKDTVEPSTIVSPSYTSNSARDILKAKLDKIKEKSIKDSEEN